MFISRIKSNIRPIDSILLFYVLFTGVFIVLGYNSIEQAFNHLLFRVGILILMVSILLLHDYYTNSFISFIRNFYVLGLLGFFYSETDALNNVFSQNLDHLFVNLEEKLFNGQPSILFYEFIPAKWFNELMNFSYFCYYPLIFILCYILFEKQPIAGEYSMFIICTSFFIFYIVFIFLPVAGPQYFFTPPSNTIPKAYLFSNIMHFINCLGERPTAAFPSSHVGIITIVLYLCMKFIPNLLKWYIPIAFLLFLSTVYIKAHYLIDVFAGIISAPILYWLSSKIYLVLLKYNGNKFSNNQT